MLASVVDKSVPSARPSPAPPSSPPSPPPCRRRRPGCRALSLLHEGEEVTGRVRNLEQPPDLDPRPSTLELGGPSLLYPRPFPSLHNLASPPLLLLLSSQPSTLVSVRFFLLLPLSSKALVCFHSPSSSSVCPVTLSLTSLSLSSPTTTTTAVLFYLIPFLISTPFASFFDS